MSDLGTYRYNIANHPGNQASFSALTDAEKLAQIENAKQHVQQNTVGKIAKDFSGNKEDPMGPLKAFLYGIPAAVGLTKISDWVNRENKSGIPRIEAFFNKIDQKISNSNVLKGTENRIKGFWNYLKNSPFTAPIRHFVKPEHVEKYKPINSFARQATRTLPGEVLNELIERSSQFTEKTIGKDAAVPLRVLERKFKQGTIPWQKAYEELFETIGKLGLTPDKITDKNFLKLFQDKNNRILATSGYVLNNAGKLVERSNSIFSKAARAIYSGSNRFFRVGHNPIMLIMTSYFVGDTIKRAVDARKGEKFSTFMEGMLGDVLPFWALIAALTRFPYQMMEGLKKAPEAMGKHLGRLGRTIGKPFKWFGNFISIGLKGELTPKMTPEAAEKLLGKEGAEKFSKLAQRIASGNGTKATKKAIKKLFKDSVPFLKRFGIRFKNVFGGGIRLALIMGVLMTGVSGVLKSVSHSLFGKPTNEEEEAAKAKTKADSAQDKAANWENLAPLTREYMQKIKGIDSTQQKVITEPQMVTAFINKIKENPYDRKTKILSSQEISKENVPARSINTPQKDYSSTPMPITTNPQAVARANKAIREVDKLISSTEQTLQNI